LKKYIEFVKKFLNIEKSGIKDLMFSLMDLNKDKYICETDLYNLRIKVEDKHLAQIIGQDINTVFNFNKT